MTKKGERQLTVTRYLRRYTEITGNEADFNSWARYIISEGLRQLESERR